jgi:DNA-3-methyladenine glycosylase II
LPANAEIERALTRADPALGRVIAAVTERKGRQRPSRSKVSAFEALVRAVIYQRMATQAAAAIHKNLRLQLSGSFTAQRLLSLPVRTLRSVGLSSIKAQYVRNLAEWFSAHATLARKLSSLPDEAIIEALTAVPGIGLWTVNVFLIFSLQRPDVVPASDLGIRKSVQIAFGLAELPTPRFVAEQALRWRPYRSIASVYLWQAIHLKLTSADLNTRGGVGAGRSR